MPVSGWGDQVRKLGLVLNSFAWLAARMDAGLRARLAGAQIGFGFDFWPWLVAAAGYWWDSVVRQIAFGFEFGAWRGATEIMDRDGPIPARGKLGLVLNFACAGHMPRRCELFLAGCERYLDIVWLSGPRPACLYLYFTSRYLHFRGGPVQVIEMISHKSLFYW